MSATRIIAMSALVCATACRQPLPCDDCDAHDDEQDAAEEEPVPDLPCGGADLMTDNDHCGVCGNECNVWYEGTEWEGGGCEAGKCGPRWIPCFNSTGNASTCDEICAAWDLACVPAGCSGLTAMLFDDHHFAWDVCSIDDEYGPDGTMDGACTDPIPWEVTDEWERSATCCCG